MFVKLCGKVKSLQNMCEKAFFSIIYTNNQFIYYYIFNVCCMCLINICI